MYTIMGFAMTFVVMGVYFLIMALFVGNMFASHKFDLNMSVVSHISASHVSQLSGIRKQPIGYMTLMKKPRFIMAGLSSALAYFIFGYMDPILANRLIEFEFS